MELGCYPYIYVPKKARPGIPAIRNRGAVIQPYGYQVFSRPDKGGDTQFKTRITVRMGTGFLFIYINNGVSVRAAKVKINILL